MAAPHEDPLATRRYDREHFTVATGATIYVCGACGKRSPTREPGLHSDPGWDESCMLKAVLCHNPPEYRGRSEDWQDEKWGYRWQAVGTLHHSDTLP